MYSDTSTPTDVLSLQLKYEQVCLKEKEASSRNSSFKRDIARVRRKMAASSIEAKTKRLQLLKKQYEDLAYSTWLAESAMNVPPDSNRHSEPVRRPPKYLPPFSISAASSLTHPMLTSMKSKPVASSVSAHSSLHQTLHISSELPPHHVSHIARGVSPLLTSTSASSHLRYSTSTVSPISHPVPFVPPSTAPEVGPISIPFSYSISSSPTSSVSTSKEVEDQISSFHPQATMSASTNSSKLSLSSPLSPHEAPPIPIPSSTPKNIVILPESDLPKQTPSISPLSTSSNISLSLSSKTSDSDIKAELIPEPQRTDSKAEIEEGGTAITEANTFENNIPIPMQSQNEMELKEEVLEVLEDNSDVGELNQEDIPVPSEMALASHEEKKMTGEDSGEVEIEDGGRGGEEECEKKQQIGEETSEQYNVRMEEEKQTDEESLTTESVENIQQSAVGKESPIHVISTSSLSEQSQINSKQDKYPVPASASPSQHMSAYYKMVGQFKGQNTSPIPSLSSEGSDLEDDLRLAVSKSPDNEEDDLLSLPSTANPSPKPVVQSSGLAVSVNPPESSAVGQKSKKSPIDSTSLKRRMGLVSSSEEELSFKQDLSSQHKSPLYDGNTEVLDADEEDDDDFDFYS